MSGLSSQSHRTCCYATLTGTLASQTLTRNGDYKRQSGKRKKNKNKNHTCCHEDTMIAFDVRKKSTTKSLQRTGSNITRRRNADEAARPVGDKISALRE